VTPKPAALVANANAADTEVIDMPGDPHAVVRLVAYGVFTGLALTLQQLTGRALPVPHGSSVPQLPANTTAEPGDVITADEVAAFLGVDRNTVYEYAGRGVIPHQRLGKRILFRRGALVSWLDASCKATSTRKG
jgi:excisionase family DNA binding protein